MSMKLISYALSLVVFYYIIQATHFQPFDKFDGEMFFILWSGMLFSYWRGLMNADRKWRW